MKLLLADLAIGKCLRLSYMPYGCQLGKSAGDLQLKQKRTHSIAGAAALIYIGCLHVHTALSMLVYCADITACTSMHAHPVPHSGAKEAAAVAMRAQEAWELAAGQGARGCATSA